MTEQEPQILNIAAYKFVDLFPASLPELQHKLKNICQAQQLKGTILLSPEGINIVLAGLPQNVLSFWNRLTSEQEFSGMDYKSSWSSQQPFKRLKVKIKHEIIPMHGENIRPVEFLARRVSPQTLRQWLQEGREFTLLDTRNDYEIQFGTFNKAEHLNIKTFQAFTKAVEKTKPELKDKPVVIFCTGGIRCEKAAPLMAQKGFREVYQLNGGILRYFEECGDAYYDGACFVYDDRIALNGQLEETGSIQCPTCFGPVTAEEQHSPEYVPGHSCLRCRNGK